MILKISASAGSGKTYTLTRHFLELLENADPCVDATGCALFHRGPAYSLAEILAAIRATRLSISSFSRTTMSSGMMIRFVRCRFTRYERAIRRLHRPARLVN